MCCQSVKESDEVTVLGVGVQIVLGIFDLDLPCDIRDIIADVRNLAQADEIKWDMIAMLALDLIGVIPVIGALKYSDEIGTLFKNADKVSVNHHMIFSDSFSRFKT